ncbi:MAG: hypothetical protein QNJ57_12305 [Flavobacteriaceae bacterium]|nr:hypothetical protein [Flavobacteriaceae bacterium]
MRNFFLYAVTILLMSSCALDDDSSSFELQTLPIKSAEVPASFTLNELYNITVTYDLPNGCHNFHSLFFQQEGNERIVAINTLVSLGVVCTEALIEESFTFDIIASQRDDYVFKFWKGVDTNGENIFDEVIVPVNE